MSALDRRCPACGAARLPDGWPRCSRCDRLRKRAARRAEPKGVYLAVLKTPYPHPRFILKLGESGQLRSKAGRLASDAWHKHSIMADWGEVVLYRPVESYEERRTLETEMLRAASADAYDGTEYFWPRAYDAFVSMLGPEAVRFERRTTKARVQEFFDSLALAA